MTKMFTLTRENLAQLIAADTSGFEDAIPEQADLDLADTLIKIKDRYQSDVRQRICPESTRLAAEWSRTAAGDPREAAYLAFMAGWSAAKKEDEVK